MSADDRSIVERYPYLFLDMAVEISDRLPQLRSAEAMQLADKLTHIAVKHGAVHLGQDHEAEARDAEIRDEVRGNVDDGSCPPHDDARDAMPDLPETQLMQPENVQPHHWVRRLVGPDDFVFSRPVAIDDQGKYLDVKWGAVWGQAYETETQAKGFPWAVARDPREALAWNAARAASALWQRNVQPLIDAIKATSEPQVGDMVRIKRILGLPADHRDVGKIGRITGNCGDHFAIALDDVDHGAPLGWCVAADGFEVLHAIKGDGPEAAA